MPFNGTGLGWRGTSARPAAWPVAVSRLTSAYAASARLLFSTEPLTTRTPPSTRVFVDLTLQLPGAVVAVTVGEGAGPVRDGLGDAGVGGGVEGTAGPPG